MMAGLEDKGIHNLCNEALVEVTKMELDKSFVYPPRRSVVQRPQTGSEPCRAAVAELQ